jgi:hypothetical protein
LHKIHLIFTFVGISTIALLYGVSPQWFARTFLDIPELELDFAHILRAVMGLYLALGLFWLYGAFNDKYRNPALLTFLIFAAGLVIGRIVSVLADGLPSPILMLYLFLELIFVPITYWIFKQPDE